MLVDDNQLEAVISLPSGVFKPYAGVSTGILVFTKGGRTDNVFFYDVQADGFVARRQARASRGKRLARLLARWHERDPKNDTDRTAKAFFVPAKEIRDSDYDLSLSRYKEAVYEEQEYDPPQVILGRMKALNDEIASELTELEEMLA